MRSNTQESEYITYTQQRLRALYGPHHYYTTHYSGEEMLYCGQVPGWIEEYASKLTSDDRTLDIGPGYGTLACVASQLSPARVVTLDKLPLISESVAEEFNLSVRTGDIEREMDDCWGSGFSMVVMTEVLEHFNFHPGHTMQFIHSLMKPGGRLYLSTPDGKSWRPSPVIRMDDMRAFGSHPGDSLTNPRWIDGHIHHYHWDELTRLLDDAGFNITRTGKSTSPGGEHFNIEAIARF